MRHLYATITVQPSIPPLAASKASPWRVSPTTTRIDVAAESRRQCRLRWQIEHLTNYVRVYVSPTNVLTPASSAPPLPLININRLNATRHIIHRSGHLALASCPALRAQPHPSPSCTPPPAPSHPNPRPCPTTVPTAPQPPHPQTPAPLPPARTRAPPHPPSMRPSSRARPARPAPRAHSAPRRDSRRQSRQSTSAGC